MEPAVTSIQVLLQAAEFLERRERGAPGPRYSPGLAEAEHGYASLRPARSRRAVGSVRSVHNALEKHRYRGVAGRERPGKGWPVQDLWAQRAKDQLRNRQQSLQQRLERLLLPTSGERVRADSLDWSQISDPSEEEDAEIEVDDVAFGADLLPGFGTGKDHNYSSPCGPVS
ncbi:MAD3 protein, partial [Alcedo cyanopectus]|nr:MAD3 protein [Ceyx cyanopectus]